MYTRILVPTDGSEASNAALQEALQFARLPGARVRLMHVVDEILGMSPQIYGKAYESIIAARRKAGRDILADAESLFRKEGMAAETELVEASGRSAGELIVDAAGTWPADLIVCGTHGRRGMRRLLMGSDAEYIVRHAPVPVLVIREARR